MKQLKGKKTYIWCAFVTIFVLGGIITGKCDFEAGFGIIGTMGLGSLLRASQPDKNNDD